jgi:alpha/beta superfamily hydrolase
MSHRAAIDARLSRIAIRVVICATLALGAAVAGAAMSDVARETRWAEQIVPQLVVGDAVWLATPRQPRVLALYTEPAKATREAVIVVHGMGVNPDWNLIGVLRTALADRGFATLSVQMPVLAADARSDAYGTLFPDAGERLTAAVAWLRARGYARIAIVSHSMGAAMTDAWLARAPPGVDAWVPVGMMDRFAVPPRQPVLDVVAERDFPEALEASEARKAQLPRDACSGSLVVSGTDHYFGDAATRLAEAIAPFIARALGGSC